MFITNSGNAGLKWFDCSLNFGTPLSQPAHDYNF